MNRIIILFILSMLLIAQVNMCTDTSFTIYSAYKNTIKKYPDIKIAAPVSAENVKSSNDITYIKYGDRELKLDIFYLSCDSVLSPGIILVHGGGWNSGNKSLQHPLAVKLAENGFTAVTIEYRLAEEEKFPAAVCDVNNSVKWLKHNADKYKIDTNKIALLGCSAGGQIASLAALSGIEDKLNNYPNHTSKVHAIVNIDGLLDFLAEGSEEFDEVPDPKNPRAAHRWLGASHLDNPELWKNASGINFINKDSCPIIFINSSIPRFHAGRDEAIEMLNQYGIYYRVHTLDNTPHPFWLFHPWIDQTIIHTVDFLNFVLK